MSQRATKIQFPILTMQEAFSPCLYLLSQFLLYLFISYGLQADLLDIGAFYVRLRKLQLTCLIPRIRACCCKIHCLQESNGYSMLSPLSSSMLPKEEEGLALQQFWPSVGYPTGGDPLRQGSFMKKGNRGYTKQFFSPPIYLLEKSTSSGRGSEGAMKRQKYCTN